MRVRLQRAIRFARELRFRLRPSLVKLSVGESPMDEKLRELAMIKLNANVGRRATFGALI